MTKNNDNTATLSAEKVIDQAKIVEDWRRQKDSIYSLQKKLKKKDSIINALKKEFSDKLYKIALANNTISDTSDEIDDISDEQIKKEKLKWSGLHLKVGLQSEIPTFKQIIYTSRLYYELEKFDVSVYANTKKEYLLGVNFKIF